MTANKNFKRRVRARALKTGESYTATSGIVGPDGTWSPRCAAAGAAVVAIADIGRDHETLARSWRRTARGNRYAAAAASEDPRTSRDSF
jgi:hypothetical protein